MLHADEKVKRPKICIAPQVKCITAEVLRYGSHSFYPARIPYPPFTFYRASDSSSQLDYARVISTPIIIIIINIHQTAPPCLVVVTI